MHHTRLGPLKDTPPLYRLSYSAAAISSILLKARKLEACFSSSCFTRGLENQAHHCPALDVVIIHLRCNFFALHVELFCDNNIDTIACSHKFALNVELF